MTAADNPKKVYAKRKFRNFLLQPLLQVKLGLYSVLLAVGFATIIGGVFYYEFKGLYEIALKFTDLPEEFQELFFSHMQESANWIVACLLFYVVLTLFVSILYTHRLVGPTIAFRRHINALMAGQYESRIILRKHDAFLEVAEDLNRLAEKLQERK